MPRLSSDVGLVLWGSSFEVNSSKSTNYALETHEYNGCVHLSISAVY